MKEYVWYYEPLDCFVIAPKKSWGVRGFRYLSFLTDKPEPGMITKHEFIFCGEL